MVLTELSRVRKRAGLFVLLVIGAMLGTAMITAAQSDSGVDSITACIDSRNGAVYGAKVDTDDVRCNRGDEQVTWALGNPGSGSGSGSDSGSDPGSDNGNGNGNGNGNDNDSGNGSSSQRLVFHGSWQQGHYYLRGAVVEHNGSSYVLDAENSDASEPGQDDRWKLLASRGNDGQDGQDGEPGPPGTPGEKGDRGLTGHQGPFGLDGEGFVWRGEFVSSGGYDRNDVVQHEGSAWVATGDNPSGIPEESGEWDLFVSGVSDSGGNGGNDGNGDSPAGLEIERVTVEVNVYFNASDHSATAVCPEEAAHVLLGGYHFENSDGERYTTSGLLHQVEILENAPLTEYGDHGEDAWRISWINIATASIGDVLVAHAVCTSE